MPDAVVVFPEAKQEGVSVFSWKDVCYTVKVGSGKAAQDKALLTNVTGQVRAGEVIAIMGGSGAGKSTFLNTLAGRIGPGTLTGEILVDGKPRDKSNWRLQCAYVEQDDVMFTNLSVEETLTYSAMLRLPASMSKAEKLQRVERVIADLGLNGCRKTRIGNSEVRGISGGERKRVSIGIELVTNPQILFLDEPTSGLDAFNAFNIINTIKQLAVAQGKIVLMTIHQPRTDILDLFDKIVLLSVGKNVWYGSTKEAQDHFAGLGYPLPERTNPSDYFLDITTLDQRSDELKQESMSRIDKFVAAYNALGRTSVVASTGLPESKATGSVQWPSTWLGEFFTLLNRNMVDVSRDQATIGATIGQGIFLMFLIGFIFFKVSNDFGGIQNRIGLLFFICINQTFGVVMPTLAVFPIQRQIIKRERAAGSYRSSSAYLAKLVSSLPLTFAGTLVLAMPVYWMAGLQASATKYLTFICILLVHANAANALGLMVGSAVPNVQVGQIVGPLVIVVFLLFGGQLLNLDQVPVVFRWIQWVSIISYSNKALNQNEFDGLTFTCVPGKACYPDGAAVISAFSYGNPAMWYCVIINVGIATAFLGAGYFLFNHMSRPLLKLK